MSDKFQKELDSVANKEPQREFYTVIPGPRYFNKEFGFSMTIPSDKYILEEKNSDSVDNVTLLLVDEGYKDSFIDSLLAKNIFLNNGRDYFVMYINTKESWSTPKFSYFKENKDELEQMFKKGFVEKTDYLISGNKKVSFYLISKSNEAWPASLDKFLPEVHVFFEDDNNIYYIPITNYYNDNIEQRMSQIKIMEEAIKSIKFDN